MNKRLLPVLAAALACAPSVPQSNPPAPVTVAAFDPTTGNIPLPNDLALQPGASAALPPAEQALLQSFAAKKGFPSDQEVPVTIAFQTQTADASGNVTTTAPALDLTSINAGTLLVFLQTSGAAGPVALDPIQPSDYVQGPTQGTLTLHHKGRQPWAPGHYVVALRGGPNGVKTQAGDPVYAAPVFYLIAQGQNLNTEQNLGLLRAQAGSTEAAQQQAILLDQIIAQYSAHPGPYDVVDRVFPHEELAAMTTFAVAPAATQVALDPNRGLAPVPIDLLRDPRPASASCAACGMLTPLAACTFASGHFNATTGTCTDANGNAVTAVAGFEALDGFSTTGPILAATSDLVQASTVTPSTVQLYAFDATANKWNLVDPSTYITEPGEVQQQGLSPVIALQPAGATASDPSSVFRTRPLQDNTEYAVVISDGVKDKTGAPLAAGTVATILQFTSPLVDGQGNSQLTGVDNATAAGLEAMRQQLAPVLTAAAGHGIAQGHVAMAYTFKTETILSQAARLGALPYSTPDATGLPLAVTPSTPAAAFAKYGVDPAVVPGTGGNDSIGNIYEATITTFNLLDATTGAFSASLTPVPETINVLVAAPAAANAKVPVCSGPLGALGAAGIKCSPLVVFRHGLRGGRAAMLTVANTFNAAGFTVVAIDAAKHGDRSFCTPGGDPAQCSNGTTCQSALPAGAQGDTAPPGCCLPPGTKPGSAVTCGVAGGGYTYQPVSPSCAKGSCPNWTGTEGVPAVSSNYLVTSNFFRTRDTLRQDIIDESQLVRAIAYIPAGAPPTGHKLFDAMAAAGVVVDPTNVSFVGQSLGSIQGTVDVAANPRVSKSVLNVGGGTVVDIFTNSPAFVTRTTQLLGTLGIQPGANASYLQFLVVAKMILDPADPVNFAGHLTANTLPNLLLKTPAPQAAKQVLTQAAFCDQTVPNPFNYILDSNVLCPTPLASCAAAAQLPVSPTFGSGKGNFELFYNVSSGAPTPASLRACPAPPTPGDGTPGAVSHGFITDWADSAATQQAQTDAAAFLTNPTTNLPPSIQPVP